MTQMIINIIKQSILLNQLWNIKIIIQSFISKTTVTLTSTLL